MAYNKETKMYEGYIYCITNKVNGKQYVGQTFRSLKIRWKEHIKSSEKDKTNQYLHAAMNKYDIHNFNFVFIEKLSFATKEELINTLNNEEIKYIASYNTIKPNGYNMSSGGYNLINKYNEKPVNQYDLEYNLIETYESVSEASRITNLDQSDISNCCMKKKVRTVGNYIWCFKDEIPNENIKPKTKQINKYNIYGELLYEYDSLIQASIDNNVDIGNISAVCRGKAATCGGFIWRYKGDDFYKHTKVKVTYKQIIQLDMNDNFIAIFNSQKEASESTGILANNINVVCKEKKKSAGGYKWKYATKEDISNYNKAS